MSQDRFTEVTSQGWLSRIGGAIKGILFGLILFVLAFPLLFWNEGRAVDRAKTLEEGQGLVISIGADSINPANNHKLVHASAKANTEETLSDSEFNISRNALKLKRNVQMYQWIEETQSRSEKQLGGGEKTTTEYTYRKTWSESVIDSNRFKYPQDHQNPNQMRYGSRETQANLVSFGAFVLPPNMTSQINHYTPVSIDASTSVPRNLPGNVSRVENGYYLGNSASNPELGDLRVQFSEVKPTTVSIVAEQVNNSFQPYRSTVGGQISLLSMGTVDATAMFQQAQSENTILTWVLRGLGFFLMTFGLSLILKPISVLADVVPFIGNVVESGTGILSALIALALSLLTIGIAWVYYRPVLAGIIIALAVVSLWLSRARLKSAKQRRMALRTSN